MAAADPLRNPIPPQDSHRDHQQQYHRISFPSLHLGRSSRESNTRATVECKLESPPIVFYGDAENSSGALVSGQLFLNVKEEGLEIESFYAKLNIHVTQKRPFAAHCHDCANQYTELYSWTLLGQPAKMTRGEFR
jgi:hypothetical protein